MAFLDPFRAAFRAYRNYRITASMPEGGQSQVDNLTPPGTESNSGQSHQIGNTYTTYEGQVQTIYDMYQNKLRYGCGALKNIVRFRSVQIAGNGANFSSDHKPTNEFVQSWAKRNGLTGGRLVNDVRLSEMEGKAVLFNGIRDGEVVVRTLPWYRWRYQVNGAPSDGGEADSITYRDASGKEQTLTRDHFVYIKVGGALCDDEGYILNSTTPPVAPVLWRLVYIDRALSDLRDNNNLFARAVQVVEAPDALAATSLRSMIFGKKSSGPPARQSISKRERFVIEGKLYYAEPSGTGSRALIDEAQFEAQVVSGETGVPVHYMGFPDLMSNRATAEDMHEMINAATLDSREAWKEGLRRLAVQACILDGGNYDTDSIDVSLPVVMLSQIKYMASTWIPLKDAGVVHKETIRERLPGVDPEREAELDELGEAKAAEIRKSETSNVLNTMLNRSGAA